MSETKNSSKTKTPSKELCEWSKPQLRDHFDLLEEIVAEPKYACTKCGRAAKAKKWLCKAKKLSASNDD